MGFLSDIKNSVKTYSIATTGNMNIIAGKGDAYIETHTGNANISTKNGNHTFAVDVNNDLTLSSGCKGNDQVYGNAGNAWVCTHDDDDTVVLNCGNLDLDVGYGDNNVIATAKENLRIVGDDGDNAIIAASFSTSADNRNEINLGHGNQTIETIGNNFDITTGDGDLKLGFVGDGYDVFAGHGNSQIGFYGNNIKIDVGDGNHDIRSLDNWFIYDEFTNTNSISQTGIFDFDLSLVNAFESRIGKFSTSVENQNLYYGLVEGASNVSISAGNGILQGLVTVGDGDFSVSQGNIHGKNISILLGEKGALQNFAANEFRGQNGYLLYLGSENAQ